ncbi:hypothetical protein ACWEVP_31895 [Amycolatopsis sp. NPDC003865]
MPDQNTQALSCLGNCGCDGVVAALPFCRECFDRLPISHRVMLRTAHGTRDLGLLTWAVIEASAWAASNPRDVDHADR